MDDPPIEASPAQWDIVRTILRARVPDREVWAFGSRATRRAKPYSDLDLVVIGDSPLGLDTSAVLAEAFSESDLPWKVDIVDWATTSEAFRRIIESTKVVVQAGRERDASGADGGER